MPRTYGHTARVLGSRGVQSVRGWGESNVAIGRQEKTSNQSTELTMTEGHKVWYRKPTELKGPLQGPGPSRGPCVSSLAPSLLLCIDEATEVQRLTSWGHQLVGVGASGKKPRPF